MTIPDYMVFPEKCKGCPHFMKCYDDGSDIREVPPIAPWRDCKEFKKIEEEGLTEKMPDFGDPPCCEPRIIWTST
jgi:hypothetical protein